MYFKEDNHFVEATKTRTRVKSLSHEIFLDENVDEKEYYRNVVSLLRNQVAEGDDVELYISNGGGMVHTAHMIADAMSVCKGNLIGYLSGEVCSAATMLALKCDSWVIGENIQFMIHGASYGIGGKATDIDRQQNFNKEWHEKMFRNHYEGFLTEDEIQLTLEHGKEHWFDSETVKERLETFVEYRQSKQEESINSFMDEQSDQMEQYSNTLLNKLVDSGTITQEQKEIADEVQKELEKLDESLSDEEVQIILQGETVRKCNVTIEEHDNVVSKVPNSLDIKTMKDVCTITWEEDDSGNIVNIDMEGLNIEQDSLEKLSKEDLKGICKEFGIKVAHNSKNETLAKKLVDFIELEIINSLD